MPRCSCISLRAVTPRKSAVWPARRVWACSKCTRCRDIQRPNATLHAMGFRISATAIEPSGLLYALTDARAGACVTFEGWVRNHNDGQPVLSLEYEAYTVLAESEGEKILAEAHA